MKNDLRILAVIPARGGSKGIPGKNIKCLGGKPLIGYTIEYVKALFDIEDICLTTDDKEIMEVAERFGLKAPFVRPDKLATDNAGTFDVLIHALQHYEQSGRHYDMIALFQPTSPFRLHAHFYEALKQYEPGIDSVVSVVSAKGNPYYLLMEEDKEGYLVKSKAGDFNTRQEAPDVFQINGSIYLYNVESIKRNPSKTVFTKIRKYVMDDVYVLDIDNMIDWHYAEFLLEKRLITYD